MKFRKQAKRLVRQRKGNPFDPFHSVLSQTRSIADEPKIKRQGYEAGFIGASLSSRLLARSSARLEAMYRKGFKEGEHESKLLLEETRGLY